jgi:4-amino-4-deoxy-L-arabinose transferase-like glycosyltransferase
VTRLTAITESFSASRADRTLGIAAILVAGLMLFWGLGSVPLMQPDEGRNAEVGREMAVTGSWLVPTLEGHPYLDKPAAYFAAVAISLRVFGVNEWGARMPSALCGLAILAMVYAFARRRYDPATAALAVIVVATSPMVFAFSRIVIMDIALAVCTVAAILAGFVAEDGAEPDRRWHAAGAAAAGVGMLVKGPVGALVPAAVLVVFFIVDGRPRALRRVFAPVNVVIVLGLFLPWFAGLVHVHPEFLHYGLVEETFNRFFTPAFNRGQPFWFFGPELVAAILPWTVLFVPMVFAAWSARSRLSSADRLFIVWTIVVIAFFSTSRTKQPGYILTAVVSAAVLVGRGLGHAWRNGRGRAARLVSSGSLVFGVLAIAAAAWIGWAVQRGAVSAVNLAGMTAGERSLWSMWPAVAIVLFASGALGAAAYARKSSGLAVAAFALFPVALVTVLLPAVVGFASARSAKTLAAELASLPRDAELACLDGYPAGLSFYLGKTLTVISDTGEPLRSNFIVYALRKDSVRPATIVASSERDRWLGARTTPAMVLAPQGSHDDLAAWLGSRVPVSAAPNGWWTAMVPSPEAR